MAMLMAFGNDAKNPEDMQREIQILDNVHQEWNRLNLILITLWQDSCTLVNGSRKMDQNLRG
jgi:hypothetical protein